MVKFCMFSRLRLWSLVGSVRGCWARAAPVINRTRIPTREFRVSSFKFRENHPFPIREYVGHPGVPPPPPRIFVFNEVRTFSAQNIERVRVTRKIFWNKDLAVGMAA